MKNLRIAGILLTLPFLAAQAQTLDQKNMIAQDKVQVAELAAATNKKCGTNIAFSMDYPSFLGIKTDPDNVNGQSPWAYLADTTDALNSVCGTPDGQASVKAKIQRVVVSHTKDAKTSESLSGGTLHVNSSYKDHNVQTITSWLGQNL